MGFRNGAYGKVWTVERKEKYTKISFSTSKKDKNTGEYETDFSAFVNLVGAAHQKASNLEEGDRIKIIDCETTTTKKNDVKYTNHTIWDWEPAGTTSGEPKPAVSATKAKSSSLDAVEDSEDELPF